MRMGLLRVRQQRARGALRADLFACIAFLAPPPLFLAEPVDPRVSDFPPSPPGGASVEKKQNILIMLFCFKASQIRFKAQNTDRLLHSEQVTM